jgi:hypothetical protein
MSIYFFIEVWWVASCLSAIFGNVIFLLWLKSLNVKTIRFGFSGMPGYLDRVSEDWCRSRGIRPKPFIRIFRVGSIVSAIVSTAVFMAIDRK